MEAWAIQCALADTYSTIRGSFVTESAEARGASFCKRGCIRRPYSEEPLSWSNLAQGVALDSAH